MSKQLTHRCWLLAAFWLHGADVEMCAHCGREILVPCLHTAFLSSCCWKAARIVVSCLKKNSKDGGKVSKSTVRAARWHELKDRAAVSCRNIMCIIHPSIFTDIKWINKTNIWHLIYFLTNVADTLISVWPKCTILLPMLRPLQFREYPFSPKHLTITSGLLQIRYSTLNLRGCGVKWSIVLAPVP